MEYELDVHAVVLIRPASLPRTTSGKPQRALCREQFLANELKVLSQWRRSAVSQAPEATGRIARLGPPGGNGAAAPSARSGHATTASWSLPAAPAGRLGGNGNGAGAASARSEHATNASWSLPAPPAGALGGNGAGANKQWSSREVDRLGQRVEAWLLDWMVQRGGVPPNVVDADRPFAEYGLDSVTAVQLSGELEDWLHVRLTPVVAWNYPTPATLARYLARRAAGLEPDLADESEPSQEEITPASSAPRSVPDNDFERLLSEIEGISEAEAETALRPELDGP
jgi:acyl carrier protein